MGESSLMALKDLIAQAGPQLYETMRKGWLPTVEEKQSRRMKDLQIQSAEDTLAYAPTKRKLAQQSSEMDLKYKQSLISKHEQDAARIKSEDDAKLYVVNQEKIGKHFSAASKLKTNKDKKAYFNRYKEELLDIGDDAEDKAFIAVMNQSGEQFNQSFDLMLQGNKYLQGLSVKRFGKSTSLQNYKTGETETVMFNDPKYQEKIDNLLTNKDFTIIKTPNLNIEGTPSELGLNDKKLNREIVNEQSAIETANFIGGRTIDLIMKSPEALSATGAFARIATSVKSQLDSMVKSKWDPKTSFEPGSYREIFQNAGIDNVVIRGNMTQLARMLATASGEGKVLSDADMKRWLNVVAVGNGDPKTVSKAIRNALEIQNFRFKQKYRNVKQKDFEGDLYFPKEASSAEVTQRKKEIADRLTQIRQLKKQRDSE